MKWLRDRGWIVARVEQIIHMPNRPFPFKKDAFGFGDLLAANSSIALIQATSGSNAAKRATKIIGTPEIAKLAQVWLRSNGCIYVQGWAKRGPRGKRKTWTVRTVSVFWDHTAGCFQTTEVPESSFRGNA